VKKMTIDMLKKQEGFRAKPYNDSEGLLTIGYGTLIEDGISKEEAELLLLHRVEIIEKELIKNWSYYERLDEIRKSVLLNMAYNLGVPRLMLFKKTLSFVEAGKYKEASVEMLDSKWARQVGRRATLLSDMMKLEY
jgi:lysozyme